MVIRLAKHLFLKMVEKDVDRRYSASEALLHPWITGNLSTPLPQTRKDREMEAQTKKGLKVALSGLIILAKVKKNNHIVHLLRKHIQKTEARSPDIQVRPYQRETVPTTPQFILIRKRPSSRAGPADTTKTPLIRSIVYNSSKPIQSMNDIVKISKPHGHSESIAENSAAETSLFGKIRPKNRMTEGKNKIETSIPKSKKQSFLLKDALKKSAIFTDELASPTYSMDARNRVNSDHCGTHSKQGRAKQSSKKPNEVLAKELMGVLSPLRSSKIKDIDSPSNFSPMPAQKIGSTSTLKRTSQVSRSLPSIQPAKILIRN